MADLKEKNVLNTRIKLRYDSYENWSKSTLTLLPGEVALCYVEANNSEIKNTAPTVLFKVGDGEHTFKDLKWASARAADVYDWAKAETRPTYTKADVGLGNVANVESYSKTEVDNKISEIQGALEADTNTTYRFDFSEGNKLGIYKKDIGSEEVKVGDFVVDFTAIENAISLKADKTELNNYYTKTEADGKFLTSHQDISGKADKSYVDEELGKKANTSYVNEELAKKADASSVYTKTESDGKFSVIGHNHDDIYYRATAIDTKVEEINKALGIHSESIEDLVETVGGIDSRVDGLVETVEAIYGENGEIKSIKGRLDTAEGNITNLTNNKADKSDLKDWELKADADLVRGRVSTLEGHFGEKGRVTVAEGKISTLEIKVGNLSGAFQFKGTAESLESLPAASADNAGHVYVIGSKEYVSDGSSWILLGDEGSYVLKTTYEAHLLAQEAVDQGQSDKIKAIEDDIKANRERWASKTSVTDPTAGDGKILVDGNEMVVYDDSALAARVKSLEENPYQLPSDVVRDSEYKHITVTENSVSAKGGATFTKYDDTALAGRVSALEAKPFDTYATKDEVKVERERIDSIVNTTIPTLATKEEVANTVNGINGTIATLATKSEVAGVEGKVDGVIADYLKGSDKTELQGKIDEKQDIITDLETIRSGAALGATAVQPSAIVDMLTKTEAASTYETIANVTTVSNRVKAIEDDATILRSTDYIIFDCGGAGVEETN